MAIAVTDTTRLLKSISLIASTKNVIQCCSCKGGDKMDETRESYFFCYDSKLRDFFKINKIRYIFTAKNFNDKQFWLYKRDSDLKQLIENYNK